MYPTNSIQILRQQAHQQALQDILNRQSYMQSLNQIQNGRMLPRADLANPQYLAEYIQRNQTILELEKLKMIIDNDKKLWRLLTKPVRTGAIDIVTPKAKPKLTLHPFQSNQVQIPNLKPLSLPTVSAEPFAMKADSPLSEASSGIGTLSSPPFSDWDMFSNIGTPTSDLMSLSSPPILVDEVAKQGEHLETTDALKARDDRQLPVINYQGRDLLDLHHNLTHQWGFQMTALPPYTIHTHFQYRSLYHRLGPYGLTEQLAMDMCPDCDFHMVNVEQQAHN